MPDKRLRRVREHAVIGGVCGGVAYWLEFPAWLVRLVWALLVLGAGMGLLVYLLLFLVAPRWDTDPPDYAAVTDS